MAQITVCDTCLSDGTTTPCEATAFQIGSLSGQVVLCEHHLEELVKPFRGNESYPCPEEGCGRVFPTKQGVTMHLKRSH